MNFERNVAIRLSGNRDRYEMKAFLLVTALLGTVVASGHSTSVLDTGKTLYTKLDLSELVPAADWYRSGSSIWAWRSNSRQHAERLIAKLSIKSRRLTPL
jgi:hypothetical protein